jgi:Arc/MetJ family transcription regulator
MATNLALDDNLIAEVVKLGNFKSKKAAVTQALQEYIQRHKQAQILQLFGTIDYDEDYDYKQGRSRS